MKRINDMTLSSQVVLWQGEIPVSERRIVWFSLYMPVQDTLRDAYFDCRFEIRVQEVDNHPDA